MAQFEYILFGVIFFIVLIFLGITFGGYIEEEFQKYNEEVPEKVEEIPETGISGSFETQYDITDTVDARIKHFLINFNESYPHVIEGDTTVYNTFTFQMAAGEKIKSNDLKSSISSGFKTWAVGKGYDIYYSGYDSYLFYFNLNKITELSACGSPKDCWCGYITSNLKDEDYLHPYLISPNEDIEGTFTMGIGYKKIDTTIYPILTLCSW